MTKGMKVLTIDRSTDPSIDGFTGFHRFYATVIGRQVEPKKQLSSLPITAGGDRSIDRSIVDTFIPFVIVGCRCIIEGAGTRYREVRCSI